MVRSSVGAALLVLSAVVAAVTGLAVGGHGSGSPLHFRAPVHLVSSECPPVTEVIDYTETELVQIVETVTLTSVNVWPVDMVLTKFVYETSTSYLSAAPLTVTPLLPRETLHVTVTTPVIMSVSELYVKTIVDTASRTRTVPFLQYVTPVVITDYLPLTETVIYTVSSSFTSTNTHYTNVLVTEYSSVTATTHVYDTATDFTTVFKTDVATEYITIPVYSTATTVAAISTVQVLTTASCIPVAPAPAPALEAHTGKASVPSVHEKLLKVKEYLRDKFEEVYEKGREAFDVHIDKLRRKVDQSKLTSTSKVSTSYADQPSLRKIQPISPLDYNKASSSGAGLLGAGKAGGSGKGSAFSWFTELFNKGSGKGDAGTAGLGSGKGTSGLGAVKGGSSGLGNLGQLKSFAGALLQAAKSPSDTDYDTAPLASADEYPSHY